MRKRVSKCEQCLKMCSSSDTSRTGTGVKRKTTMQTSSPRPTDETSQPWRGMVETQDS